VEDPDADTHGRMLRPEAIVLPDGSLVPVGNVLRPPPNRFTHRLLEDEPYRFDDSPRTADPAGVLPAGTRVALLVEGADRCRVVDERGLYVDVRPQSLGPL
jgi:hypothetical protein